MLSRAIILCFLLFNSSDGSGILDIFWEPNLDSVIEKREEPDVDAQKSCTCDGPSCNCCVDFNMTYIDLGGPGCVEMKYISQNEGITVNISYGDNQLHTQQVKNPDPQPACLTLLANFAEICARFSVLEPHEDGLRGCVLLEPKLLGDTQTRFEIGCFLMGNEGMKIDPNGNSTLNLILDNVNQIGNPERNQTTESLGFTEEELIAVVNESAEKGLVLFSNLLGLAFGKSGEDGDEDSPQNNATAIVTNSTNS